MNSANQHWSRWDFIIHPATLLSIPFEEVKLNAARFMGKLFGGTSSMSIEFKDGAWRMNILTEGHPCHEPSYEEWVKEVVSLFMENGFGQGTITTLSTRLLAGSRQNGAPADQAIVLPQFQTETRLSY